MYCEHFCTSIEKPHLAIPEKSQTSSMIKLKQLTYQPEKDQVFSTTQ